MIFINILIIFAIIVTVCTPKRETQQYAQTVEEKIVLFPQNTDIEETTALFPQNADNDFIVSIHGTIMSYNGNDKIIVIPRQIRGSDIIGIGPEAFQAKDITSVIIPESVMYIGTRAFANNQLTNVSILGNIVDFGSEAFMNNHLNNVTITGDHVKISTSAFKDSKLNSLNISGNYVNINASAFKNKQLTSVTITGNNVSIGASAFSDNQLESITISGHDVNIGSEAFNGNPLTIITLGSRHTFNPNIVPSISEGNLSSLYYDYCCNGRQAGTYVVNRGIGEEKSEGDYNYFETYYGIFISDYTGQGGNITIPNEFGNLPVKAVVNGFNNKRITHVHIPYGVTSIGVGTFANNQLTSVSV